MARRGNTTGEGPSAARKCMAALSLVVIAACAGYMALRKRPALQGERPVGTTIWRCEACGATYAHPGLASPRPCERCGEVAAVRVDHYYCARCRAAFPAYLSKFPDHLAADLLRKEQAPLFDDIPSHELIRPCEGAHEWVSTRSRQGIAILSAIACPRCGATDRAVVRPATAGQALAAFGRATPPGGSPPPGGFAPR